MGRKKKDVIEEIRERARELIELLMMDKTKQCDPAKSNYTLCVTEKALIHIELRKRADKMFHQLAFQFVTTDSLDEKEAIESIVNHFIEVGLITEVRWQKMLNDVLRYVSRISGIDTRERVRRIAEKMDELFEEGVR
jgi:hypothetical protein